MAEADPILDTPEPLPQPAPVPVRERSVEELWAEVDAGGDPTDRFRVATAAGLVQDPARAARIARLRDRVRLPADLIDGHEDEIEQAVRAADFDHERFRRDSPLVADWLARDPYRVGITRDELAPLAELEAVIAQAPDFRYDERGRVIEARRDGFGNVFDQPAGLLRELRRRDTGAWLDRLERRRDAQQLDQSWFPDLMTGAAQSIAATQRALGTGSQDTQAAAQRMADAAQELDPSLLGDIQRGVGGLAADAPLMLAGGGLATVARSLTTVRRLAQVRRQIGVSAGVARYGVGAAGAGIATQPLALREGLVTGQEHSWADGLASWGIESAITGAFGRSGVESATLGGGARASLPAARLAVARRWAADAGLEGAEEVTVELAHALHEAASGIDPHALDGDKLVRRLLVAGAVGGLAGAAFTAPQAVAEFARSRLAADEQTRSAALAAAEARQTLAQAAQALDQTPNLAQVPTEQQTLLQSLVANKSGHLQVFIDPEAWEGHFRQRGANPAQAAQALFGDARTFNEAKIAGTPIAIPMDAFLGRLLADQQTRQFWLDEARVGDPQAMNAREFDAEFLRATTAEAPEPGAEPVAGGRDRDLAAIQDQIAQQLTATGTSPDAAARMGEQMARVFVNLAGRSQQDAQALFARWGIRIERPDAPILGRPIAESVDQVFARVGRQRREAAIAEAQARTAASRAQADAEIQAQREALVRAAEGLEGDQAIDDAMRVIETEARELRPGQVPALLGLAFGFRPDARAALTPEQSRRGEILIAALRLRGDSFEGMLKRAGLLAADPFANAAQANQPAASPSEAPPDADRLALDALRIIDLAGVMRRGLTGYADSALAIDTQAEALIGEVEPVLDRLPLEPERIAEVRRAIAEIRGDGVTMEQPNRKSLRDFPATVGNETLPSGMVDGRSDVAAALAALHDVAVPGTSGKDAVLVDVVDVAQEDAWASAGLPLPAGTRIIVKADAIRHGYKHHGAEENRPDQVPVSLPDVLALAHIFKPENLKRVESRNGVVSGEFHLRLHDGTVGVIGARLTGRGQLSAVTFWKKAKPPGTGDAQGIAPRQPLEADGATSGGLIGILPSDADPGKTLFQPAYHGTGNSVVYDRFRYDRVGGPGGEGAQAYGWGLYFASKKEVGEYYRLYLGGGATITKNGKPLVYPPGSSADAAFASLEEAANRRNADPWGAAISEQQRLRDTAETHYGRELHGGAVDQLRAWRDAGVSVEAKGRLYQVEIPEDGELLDWDKPLSEQPENVREAVRGIYAQLGGRDPMLAATPKTGQYAYRDIAFLAARTMATSGEQMNKAQAEKMASDMLRQAGIPGLHYLDQGSRATGDGSRNYVIFDDSRIAIQAYEQRRNQARGSITFTRQGDERQTTIKLFQAADLSTFLHESGHLYLELLGDAAAASGASPDLRDDYAAVLAWLGVERREQIETKHHEQWAEGFELYLRTGRPPAAAVEPMMARFAAWLASIYRDAKALLGGQPLPDQIARVMDRLVAAQDEINQSMQTLGEDPLFADATAAGMTPEQFEAYRASTRQAVDEARSELTAQAVAEVTRERTAGWREARAAMRREVEREVNAQRVYRAAAILRTGRNPDGTTPVQPLAGIKLDPGLARAQLAADLPSGPEVGAAMRRLAFMTSPANGVPPDAAARLLGYDSGSALLRDLTTMRNRGELIDAITDARMRETHGDILTDGTIAEEAMAKVHNERRGDLHLRELRALGKRIGRTPAPIEVVRSAARQRIAGTKVRDLLPSLFLRAERKARAAAYRAVMAQDWAAAFAQKQVELMNHEMYRAAADARKGADRQVQHLRGLLDAKARARIGKAGGWEWTVTRPDGTSAVYASDEEAGRAARAVPGSTYERTSSYLDQIDQLLESIDLKRATRREQDRRLALADFIREQRAAGMPINVPPSLITDRRPVGTLTVRELDGVHDAARQIEHLAGLKRRLSKLQRQRDLETTVAELVQTATTNLRARELPAAPGREGALDKLGWFWTAHRKAANLVRTLDGFEDGGPFWQALIRPINAAADAEHGQLVDAGRRQQELWGAWSKSTAGSAWKPDQVRAFDGFAGGLTRMQAIMVALNWGNQGNRDRLMRGQRVDEAQVQRVLDSLEASDWNLVESIWGHIDSHWSDIAALEERVHGVKPAKVEAEPFQVMIAGRKETIRGGYFPIATRADAGSARIDAEAAETAAALMGRAYGTAMTAHGHTKARAGGTGDPIDLDVAVIGRHLTRVIHDLTHREAVMDAARLLTNRDLVDALRRTIGVREVGAIKQWVADVASPPVANRGIPAVLAHLRRGFSMSAMGFRLSTAALQLTGFTVAVPRVGLARMASAVARLATHPRDTMAFAASKSAFMRQRGETMTRELREVMAELDKSRIDRATTTIQRAGYWMMSQTQRTVDTATWSAAYAKAIEEGRDDATAVAIADQTLIDTQGSGLTKDLSGVQRDQMGQLLTAAYTYGATTFNLLADEGNRAALQWRRGDRRAAVLDAFMAYLAIVAVPAALVVALRDLMKPDDEDKPEDSFALRHAIEMGGVMLGGMVLVRETTGSLQGFDYSGPAALKPVESAGRLLIQAGQGDLDAGLARALADTAGGLLALPSGQVRAMVEGAAWWADEPSADIRPLLFGPPPR